jgi:pyridoxine 4-dehydrogenase
MPMTTQAQDRFQLADREVARVGYGAMQLGAASFRTPVPDADALAVLRRAVELGVNHIDTAQFYGGGSTNALIRQALHPYSDDLALVSKVGARHTPDGLTAAQRPDELRAAVEENLHGLGVDRLTVVNLRRMDLLPGILATGDQRVDLDSQLAELIALRDAGKIAGIGLSHVSLAQFEAAASAGIVCVQNNYSLLDRTAEQLLDRCREQDVAWVPFFPLGSAFAGRPKVTDLPAVRAAATRLDATPAQVGLAWLLAHAPNVLLIPGTGSIAHLEQNLAAGTLRLDAATLAEMDAASR